MDLSEQPSAPTADAPGDSGEQGEVVLGGILERFLAYSIDGLIFLVGAFLSLKMAINQGLLPWNQTNHRLWMLGWTVLYVLYHSVMNSGGRAPLGKQLLGLQVLTVEGEPLSFGKSFVRAIGYLIGAFPLQLGFVWALLDSQHRAWHDIMAGTLVIETRPKSAAAEAGVSLAALGLLLFCLALTFKTYIHIPRGGGGAAAPATTEVDAAREGLRYVGELEDVFYKNNGRYTENVKELVRGVGISVSEFRQNLLSRVDADGFGIKAAKDGYIIVGSARDKNKTQVIYKGPVQP